MITENNLSILLMIVFFIGAILMLIWAKKIVKEDNKNKEASNTLNDAYLKGVWGIEQPHYNND
jgi:uncharacterized oligopeptide transporter (OPT) family protein